MFVGRNVHSPEAKLSGKRCKQQVLYIFIAGLLPNASASVTRLFTTLPSHPLFIPFPEVPPFCPILPCVPSPPAPLLLHILEYLPFLLLFLFGSLNHHSDKKLRAVEFLGQLLPCPYGWIYRSQPPYLRDLFLTQMIFFLLREAANRGWESSIGVFIWIDMAV